MKNKSIYDRISLNPFKNIFTYIGLVIGIIFWIICPYFDLKFYPAAVQYISMWDEILMFIKITFTSFTFYSWSIIGASIGYAASMIFKFINETSTKKCH